MIGRLTFLSLVASLVAFAGHSSAGEYRGMTAGWPVYANGYYAANYSANYGASPAYYVARPVVTAGYAARPSGTMYVPVRAAYANPNYFAAYGNSPIAYRPVTSGYAPAAGYYAPVTANYAPANSYAVTPAGLSSAGSEAAAQYGQASSLNYVPPRYTYRTTYAPVPVYMYRPVTTYDPITAQPVTCLQATTSTCCQPQRTRTWFSWLNPLNWFNHHRGRSACGAPPTTAYCGSAASQCGQPYYPVQPAQPVTPVLPPITVPSNVIPATPGTLPSTTFPTTPLPPAEPRIPPPPTGAAAPGSRIIVTPADTPPRLTPGVTTPLPGTTTIPGGTYTPPATTFPGTTLPGTSLPGTALPPSGSFGTGTNYPPAKDPYSTLDSAPLTPALGAPTKTPPAGPNHSVFGSGYKTVEPNSNQAGRRPDQEKIIRAPELGPAMPPSVQTVPDLDRPPPPRPANSAPQLLNPRDKTATGGDHRWAVVPAVWPVSDSAPRMQRSSVEVTTVSGNQPAPAAPLSPAFEYDDRGWKSASF